MSGWKYADIFEAVARAIPDRPCQIQGDRVVSWAEFDRRANGFAAALLDAGLGHQAKVAAYLYNCPEYLEVYVAAFKVGMTPVNTNFRYGPEEILYLFDNADAEAVVFHAAFTPVLEGIRGRLGNVKRWYVVADETGAGPDWAMSYDAIVAAGAGRVEAPWGRSGDDLLLLYTGGTTGMPKGVMWRQDDLFNVTGAGGNAALGVPPIASIEELGPRLQASPGGLVTHIACPLMHGTGQFMSLVTMAMGGAVMTTPSRAFDAGELWREVARHRALLVVIVGQAFAGPMLDWLDAHPGELDLGGLALIVSSGVMWSRENKAGLSRHLPHTVLFDSYGSSEAVGLGGSLSGGGLPETASTARFLLGPDCAVFRDDGVRVEPGSGEQGMVAISGFIPLGYYKDAAKTAQTFRTFEGRRWSVPGDWAEIDADGGLHLLGRGSVCINTGGEKVFPEEVEEALKTHPAVRDAVAVGLPDPRFGERICAVVEAEAGAAPSLDDLAAHVRTRLAAYKAPRDLVLVATIGRAVNGKVDYKALKRIAIERLGN